MTAPAGSADAIALLEADHAALDSLFGEYARLVRLGAPRERRRALAERICVELAIHTRLEEELLYPAVRQVLQDPDLVDRAEEDHGSTRDFVARILTAAPADELYDTRVAVLADYVRRHVQGEREQLLRPLRASGIDLGALARALAVRQKELRTVEDALREEVLATAG